MTLRAAIDGGHGGDISDAAFEGLTDAEKLKLLSRRRGCMVGGMTEADYTLSLSRHLAATVRHCDQDIAAWMIRTCHEDDFSWDERGFRASEFGADLLYSIHVNSFDRPELRGAIMFYNPEDKIGAIIAETLARCWPEPLRRETSAVFAADPTKAGWLRRVHNVISVHQMPAVLIEVGFASHPGNLEALHSPATQTAMVWAMMCGIAKLQQIKETTCEP